MASTAIQLSDHFTVKKLALFTLPPVLMMIFTSIYNVVDGYFVSNYAGKTAFAGVNIIWPYIQIWACLGFMFGTGGCALVSKVMGEGDQDKAERYFSAIVYCAVAAGIVTGLVAFATLRPVSRLLGADGELLEYCVRYGRILTLSMPFFILQGTFQPLMIAAERPKMGMWVTFAAGGSNIVLDYVFVGLFGWGVEGAAIASVIGMVVGGMIPFLYFLGRRQTSRLRLRPLIQVLDRSYSGPLMRACVNGMSELVTNVSLSLVSMIYNLQLMKMAGEDGVAAFGVLMYANMVFLAIFFGYSMGVSPVVSYNYGAQNHAEMRGLLRKSICMLSGVAIVMTVAAEIFAKPLARVFVGYDESLVDLTGRAFAIYSLSFLLSHFNIFGSAFFTALNDGVRSAVISFSRMLLFQVPCVLLLPLIMGLDGIWIAMFAAETLTLGITLYFYISCRKRYGY